MIFVLEALLKASHSALDDAVIEVSELSRWFQLAFAEVSVKAVPALGGS